MYFETQLKWVRAALVAALALGAAATVRAQDRPVRIVVGFPAGAGVDTLARLLAERMRAPLGQPLVVENKPGAAARIAAESVKSAPPDGNTVLLTPLLVFVTHPHLYAKLPYDPVADFTPVAHLANFTFALAAGPQVPAKSLAEFVGLVKGDAKWGTYASAGAGSLPHFFAVQFGRATGIEFSHVPYKGTAPAITDLLAGRIAAFSGVSADVVTLHRQGRLRVLATSGRERLPTLPDVPTFREQGVPVEGTGWYGLYLPAKVPRETAERLSRAAIEAMRSPELRGRLDVLGMEPTGLGPAELAAIQKADFERWGPVIRASGFTPDD